MRRKDFIQQFQTMIQDSGIKQAVIAQAVGLSSASLSQFGHAMALPKLSQFTSILDLLDITDEQRQYMTDELIKLRSRYGLGENDEFIPEEMEDFDEDDDYPDDDDEEDIPFVLFDSDDTEMDDDENSYFDDSVEEEDFTSFSQVKNFEQDYSAIGDDDEEEDPSVSFSEPTDAIPVIDIEDLRGYRKIDSLQNYACEVCEDVSFRDYGAIPSPVIVMAMGSQIGSCYNGMIQLLISDEIPRKSSMMHLALDKDGEFYLLADSAFAQANGLDSLVSKDKIPENEKKFKWIFPIVEFSILPLTKEILNRKYEEK